MSTNFSEESIGDRIRRIRSARGWSQAHLADLCGMKKAQLSRYEVGTTTPRPEIVFRIADALGVSDTWLNGGNAAVNEHEDVTGAGRDLRIPMDDDVLAYIVAKSQKSGRSIADETRTLLKIGIKYIAHSIVDGKPLPLPRKEESGADPQKDPSTD